jgi:HK97 family phage major capsid protein
MPDKTLLEELREKRSTLLASIGTAIEARQTERTAFEARTDASDEDRSAYAVAETAFGEAHQARKAELVAIDQRIDEAELQERRRADAAAASRSDASVTSEPLTYRADNQHERSYFKDLAATRPEFRSRMKDPTGALERLERHAAELNVEMPKREEARERRAQAQIERAELDFSSSMVGAALRRGFDENPFEKRVNPNRTDGQGGYFIAPLYLLDDYIPALRAGRTAANLCRQMDLPSETDTIKIPKLVTTTITGVQTTDGGAVPSQDFTDTEVSVGVKTIAGQEDVALQLIEQSRGGLIDQVIFEDLASDYNKQLDGQVLTGTNANGQIQGILPDTSWTANKVTWSSSTFLGPIFNMALGAAASKASYARYSLENFHFLMHPRRWFWFATSLDGASGTSGRPIVSADGFGPTNAVALHNGPVPNEGLAGRVPFGPNSYIDGNVPILATAAGAVTGGTNDLALGAKWDDIWLFEGALRTRVLSEVLSGTLQVRFQLYNYVTLLVRYGASISVIVGTGMAAPTAVTDTSIVF